MRSEASGRLPLNRTVGYTSALRDQLYATSDAARVKAISTIARERRLEFADELLHILSSEGKAEIRGRAAWALGRLHRKEAHDQLLHCLKASEAEMRTWSAWALGELGFYSDIPTLARAAEGEVDGEVRRAILGALRKLRLEPTRSHVSQVERLMRRPPTRDPLLKRIVEELAILEWPRDRDRIVALRREMRQADPPYFSVYMQWVQRRPVLEQAINNPKFVYGA